MRASRALAALASISSKAWFLSLGCPYYFGVGNSLLSLHTEADCGGLAGGGLAGGGLAGGWLAGGGLAGAGFLVVLLLAILPVARYTIKVSNHIKHAI